MEPRPRLHVLTAALLLCAAPAGARLLLSQKQALALAFPAGKYERKVAYLTDDERKAAENDGQVKIEARMWPYYVGVSSTGAVSYAYFDTHVVRTQSETFMAVLDEKGAVRSVELLAFAEPDDYIPGEKWRAQFKDKSARDGLFVGRAIRNITGASLTSQALTEGVRRVLAVHRLLLQSIKAKK
jgi:hypothetical protein